MKIAILTKPDDASPRILAESFLLQLQSAGIEAAILFEIGCLNRLVPFKESDMRFHFWLKKKILNWYRDRQTIGALKKMDAVIISECIPNAFWEHLYNVEKLKKILKRPVFVYEVYSIANAPTQIGRLKTTTEFIFNRYDGHLFVSPVTELRKKPAFNHFCVGLFAKTWNLKPLPKKELIALIDFAQPGFEIYRELQIRILKKAGISYISLEKRYTISDIRDLYREVSIYFMQSFEAFGLPILECLSTGAQIYTPNSGWPMSWRLDEDPQVHGKGILPGCFTVYKDEEDLLEKLLLFKKSYNKEETPLKVFNDFIKHYPSFYYGNDGELENCLNYIKNRIN